MSIINDALKKVQERLKKKDALPPVPPANALQTPPGAPPAVGPAPTFTPAGPLPSNPASSEYHQSGKPVHPSTNPPPPRTAFPSAPPKVESSSAVTKTKANKTSLLVFIFIVSAATALFFYRDQIKPIVNKLTSGTPTKKPKKLSYSKTEVIAVTEPTVAPATPTENVVDVAPAATTVKLPQDLKINGTVVMGSKTVALINNNIHEVGSQVDGFTVTEISIKKVVLEKDGQKFELVVKNEF